MTLAEQRIEYEKCPAKCKWCDGPIPFIRWKCGSFTCKESCAIPVRIITREAKKQNESIIAGKSFSLLVDFDTIYLLKDAIKYFIRFQQLRWDKNKRQCSLSNTVCATKLLMKLEKLSPPCNPPTQPE